MINEVGIWILTLQRFEEIDRAHVQGIEDFRRWLIEFRERALKA